MNAVIQLKNVTKRYWRADGTSIHAVNDVNLSIPGERLTGILGTSGAGKSTLLRLIGGYEQPDRGEIFVDGRSIHSPYDADRHRIVLLTEETQNLDMTRSVADNLEAAARFGTLSAAEQSVYAQYLLNEIHLWSRRHELVATLDSQMQRMLSIACAVVTNPYILLVNEPTADLDADAASTIMGWLRYLAHEHYRTVVVASQMPHVVHKWCDRVVLLANGRLLKRQQIHAVQPGPVAYHAPMLAVRC